MTSATTTVLLVLATAAGLLAVAWWWIRRNNLAVYPAGRAPRDLRPLDTGCELGAQLLAAATTEATGAGARGGGAARPRAAGAAAPRRKAAKAPTRRDFLRTGLLLSVGGFLATFAGASIAFLWPSLKGGFGARIDVGSVDDVRAAIEEGGGRFEYPSGRTYLVAYDPAQDPSGAYADVTQNGESPFMALYQKCVHLGCRVPWCESSQWWECPCHGSRYNRWGEYQFGPAPRGLDRFVVAIESDRVIVDTATVVTGPSRGAGAPLNQPPEGPHCTG